MTSTIRGPFGSYEWGSYGAILNAAVGQERLPLCWVENFCLDNDGILLDNEKPVGRFKWIHGLDIPVFNWTGEVYRVYNKHALVQKDDGTLEAKFRPFLTFNGTVGIQFQGDQATPELHEFLSGMLTNHTTDPRYKLHQDAGAFFQSGSHDPNSEYFMIEFWKPAGVKAFIEYLSKHFRYPATEKTEHY